jgi:hypothetical protein
VSEQLFNCPYCRRKNFSLRGLKAHRCAAKNKEPLNQLEIDGIVAAQDASLNPFLHPSGIPGIGMVQACDTQSRIDALKSFSEEQLRQVVALPGCQKTVRVAAVRLLKKSGALSFAEAVDANLEISRAKETA